jgi:hypothetical protein
MDIETLGQRAAAALLDAANAEAHSQQALDEVLSGAPIIATSPVPASSPRRWPLIAAATGVAAALVIGLVLITRREAANPVANTTVPTTVAATTAPTTPPPTTTPPSTTTPPAGTLTRLPNGLAVRLPEGAAVIRNVESLVGGFGEPTAQASATTVISWGGRDVKVQLTNTPPGSFGEVQPFQVEGDFAPGYTQNDGFASTIVRQVAEGRFVVVSSQPLDDAPAVTVEELLPVAESITYDPSKDERVTGRAVSESSYAECVDNTTSFNGGPGLPDMVIFGCDGVLGRYDGATGELEELITDKGGQVAGEPTSGEPVFSNAVYDIEVTPDGAAVYYSFGDEPAAGNTARYEFGSGTPDEEQRVGFGLATSFSPDGTLQARAGIDGVAVGPSDQPPGGSDERFIEMGGGLPLGKAVISPDNQRIAVETGPGLIAMIDVATGDVRLLANDDTSVSYFAPQFRSNDSLVVLAATGSGGAGDPVSSLVLGLDGGVLETESTSWSLPVARVPGTDSVALFGTTLRDRGGDEVGSGIVVAAAVSTDAGSTPASPTESDGSAGPGVEPDSLLVYDDQPGGAFEGCCESVIASFAVVDGCPVVEKSDGARLSVWWPVGTTLDRDMRSVVLADGRVVKVGDKLRLDGVDSTFDEISPNFNGASPSDAALACLERVGGVWVGPSDPKTVEINP